VEGALLNVSPKKRVGWELKGGRKRGGLDLTEGILMTKDDNFMPNMCRKIGAQGGGVGWGGGLNACRFVHKKCKGMDVRYSWQRSANGKKGCRGRIVNEQAHKRNSGGGENCNGGERLA